MESEGISKGESSAPSRPVLLFWLYFSMVWVWLGISTGLCLLSRFGTPAALTLQDVTLTPASSSFLCTSSSQSIPLFYSDFFKKKCFPVHFPFCLSHHLPVVSPSQAFAPFVFLSSGSLIFKMILWIACHVVFFLQLLRQGRGFSLHSMTP